MPWLAAMGGWLAWPGATPWSLTGPWRLGIVTWALVVAVAWPVTALRELDFTLATIGVPTPNGSFGMTPHLAAAFVALTAQAQLVALLLFDWAWGCGEASRRRAWLAMAPGLALACALAVWQQAVDPALVSDQPWIALARAAGPFYDANAMGALAALFAAALAGPGLGPTTVPPLVWRGSWAALALAGVTASGSRTGLAALLVSAVVAGLVALRPRLRLAGLAAVAVLAIAAAQFGPAPGDAAMGDAVGRLAGTIRRVADGGAATLVETAWRRDGYGPASLAVFADHPWVGVGPGAFASVISDYAATVGLSLPPDNAQNWWRQQLADLGLIGGAAPLLCSVLALVAVLRSWRRSRGDAARTAPVMALGLMALVSPATQHPMLQALAGLLVAHAVAPRDALASSAAPAAMSWAAGPIAWTLALGCGLGLAVEGWTSFRPPDRAARFHFIYNYGFWETVETPVGTGRRAGQRSVAVFPPGGPVLVTRVILPHDDLAAKPVVATVSDGHRVLCRHEARDHTPFECRMAVPAGRWPFVQVEVSRPWRSADGQEQAALLSGRFER